MDDGDNDGNNCYDTTEHTTQHISMEYDINVYIFFCLCYHIPTICSGFHSELNVLGQDCCGCFFSFFAILFDISIVFGMFYVI